MFLAWARVTYPLGVGQIAQLALKHSPSSPVVPLPTCNMGGSCSTVSAETRVANQPRKNKGHPAPQGPRRHAVSEPPNLAIYITRDDENWVYDVNGGGTTAPARSRRLKSPRKERVVGPERRPRRLSSITNGETMPKHEDLSRARPIAESRVLSVSSVNSDSNKLFEQQEEKNHLATQKADRKYDQQQALTHAANHRPVSAAPGDPELLAASRRTSRRQAPNASVARSRSIA